MMSNQGLGIRVSVSPLCTVFHRVRDVFGRDTVLLVYFIAGKLLKNRECHSFFTHHTAATRSTHVSATEVRSRRAHLRFHSAPRRNIYMRYGHFRRSFCSSSHWRWRSPSSSHGIRLRAGTS